MPMGEIVVAPSNGQHKQRDDEVIPLPAEARGSCGEEEAGIALEGYKDDSPPAKAKVPKALKEVDPTPESAHIVVLGDSTMDNYRYLDLDAGEQTVEMLLAKRCKQMSWQFTSLAMDGATLDDVAVRQVPVVPDAATHLVLSASGNDLLRLLNEMSSSEFSVRSMYAAVTVGLKEVSQKYRRILESLRSTGCHIACCTVYRPNFQHLFLKALAATSLGVHNGRIQEIAEDLDLSVVDLAGFCVEPEDFANPLELSTRGGCKVVENITQFVRDHSTDTMPRLGGMIGPPLRRAGPSTVISALGYSGMCCVTCGPVRRIYASDTIPEALLQTQGAPAADRLRDPDTTEFAEAQEKWRQS
mmetsp:Transcript_11596/g.22026  ORF Transcript_11596/g.22026 Transcript_11596/m.22026 type:complete len:357 (-) Transcript_11596:48-1118(-)